MSPPSAGPPAPLPLRIISYNIRYATTHPFPNEKLWSERAPLIRNQLRHELRFFNAAPLAEPVPAAAAPAFAPSPAAFVCLQEALHGQLADVLAGLNAIGDHAGTELPDGPVWAHIGVGREDGKQKGEYSPILYPVRVFKLLDSETVWLSPTPERPSKGWDADCIRILTVGVFEHRGTGRRVVGANTHLDHVGTESRRESAKLILEVLRRKHEKWSDGDGANLGIFLAGDFNSSPTQEAYLELKRSGYLVDVEDQVPEDQRYGNAFTWTGFDPTKPREPEDKIDFVWLGPRREDLSMPWAVEGYAVLANVFEDGVHLSDHRPVVGDVRLLG